MEKRIKVVSLMSATVRVSNAGDADRKYDIEADVTANSGAVVEVYNGTARSSGEPTVDEMGMERADRSTFTARKGSDGTYEFPQDMETAERVEVLTAIDAFVKGVYGSTVAVEMN